MSGAAFAQVQLTDPQIAHIAYTACPNRHPCRQGLVRTEFQEPFCSVVIYQWSTERWARSRTQFEGNIFMGSNLHTLERVRPALPTIDRPDRSDAEAALRTIIRWTGDDPERDGLVETPARVARAFEEFFIGYTQDPVEILQKTFEEIEGYDEMITLRGIRFEPWPA